ncbi:MAG: amidohydrolase family protein [Roseburia sp.]|nr:amidohydrolase family protein [Roseburia sp.]MCM1202085.1 amidohydrolase family protein [Bacteroides fragilis]
MELLDTIIKNGIVVTQNREREILKVNIGIKDGKIVKLGNHFTQAEQIIDADNAMITPAYLNAHIHFGEYYLRGYKGNLSTEEYIALGEKFYRAFLKEQDEIRSSSIDNVLCESIQNGTLTVLGVRGWPNVPRFGVNAYLGYPIMRSEKLSAYMNRFEENFYALKAYGNVEYFLGLHSLNWIDEDALKAAAAFLNDHQNIKVSLHICETEAEVLSITQKYKVSPIQLLDSLGLLNENTLLVHCNYLKQEDIDLIRKRRASVAVCHSSNLKLGNRPCAIDILLENDINVMIATDGPATSDSLSLLDAVRISALISHLDAQTLYDMITINPAKYLKINTGSVQIGNKADLLFYDRNSLHITYRNSILENLIYSPGGRPRDVMKDGSFIIKDYRFTDNIEEPVLREKNRIIQLIEKSAGQGLS